MATLNLEAAPRGPVASNDPLDALIKLNAAIPATASERDGLMIMRFTVAEWDQFYEASTNAIRVIKARQNGV